MHWFPKLHHMYNKEKEMTTKTCNKCGIEQPMSNYYTTKGYPKRNIPPYTYNYCKGCHYKKTKLIREEWVENNPERIRKLNSKAMMMYRERMTAGVYLLHTNKGTYVGQSSSIEYRVGQHIHNLTQPSGKKMKGAKILNFIILEEVEDKQLRREREKYWIQKINPSINVQHNLKKNKEKVGS